MTDCSELSERMPSVAHGRASWTSAQADHLASCDECQREWRLVTRSATLGDGRHVRTEAMVLRVIAGIRHEQVQRRRVRFASRAGVLGLATAAGVALTVFVRAPSVPNVPPVAAVDSQPLGVFPELDRLSETELEVVLAAVRTSAVPSIQPRLGDLTDEELEEMLHDIQS